MDLFPPAGFSGWTRIAIPPTNPLRPATQWKLDEANRIVLCEGDGGHEMLRYDRELKDFLLHVEWRFTKIDGEKRYNSGIFIRNNADGTIWHQAQAGLSGGFLFGNSPVNGVPQRFNLSKQMTENRVRPAGEWNTYEIRCEGKKITLSVNGAVTSEFDRCEVPRGYIALEAEGYAVSFRNLRLRVLP